jgi:glycosyltransferase involved in cell wall biosynthesis
MIAATAATDTLADNTANRLPAECDVREIHKSPRRYLMVMNELGFVYSHFWNLALRIQAAGWQVTIASDAVADPGRALDAGFKFIRLNPTFGIGHPVEEIRSFLELRGVIRSTQPHVLHLISLKNCLLGGVLARAERVPAVLCAITGLGTLFVEDGALYRALRPTVMRVLRYVLSHKNSVLALENHDDERYFIERNIVHADRARVIPGTGIAADAITPVKRPEGIPIILCVSRMIKNKGISYLLEAAKLLHDCGLEFVVHLVGDIDARNPTSLTRGELKAAEANGFVKWLGPRSDVPELLAKASVFCLPTYYREGLPQVLKEAAAAGCAIVTTDVPGCREVVVDGVSGYIVPPRNVTALAQALASLLQDTQTRERMGREARLRFEKCFTHRCVFDAFNSCYTALNAGVSV